MGKKTNQKRVKQNKTTASAKINSSDNSIIIWSFDKVDCNGEFAFGSANKDFDADKFMQKLLSFSKMKWSDLFPPNEGKSRHHPLSPESFSKQAIERINAMQLNEETDSIYSLALDSTTRLIGIRKGAIFQVVWYDAHHNFAPSNKKHT